MNVVDNMILFGVWRKIWVTLAALLWVLCFVIYPLTKNIWFLMIWFCLYNYDFILILRRLGIHWEFMVFLPIPFRERHKREAIYRSLIYSYWTIIKVISYMLSRIWYYLKFWPKIQVIIAALGFILSDITHLKPL